MLVVGGVLALGIGVVLLVNGTGEPTCDHETMHEGQVCISSDGSQQTYQEAKDSDGRWGVGLGLGAVVASAICFVRAQGATARRRAWEDKRSGGRRRTDPGYPALGNSSYAAAVASQARGPLTPPPPPPVAPYRPMGGPLPGPGYGPGFGPTTGAAAKPTLATLRPTAPAPDPRARELNHDLTPPG